MSTGTSAAATILNESRSIKRSVKFKSVGKTARDSAVVGELSVDCGKISQSAPGNFSSPVVVKQDNTIPKIRTVKHFSLPERSSRSSRKIIPNRKFLDNFESSSLLKKEEKTIENIKTCDFVGEPARNSISQSEQKNNENNNTKCIKHTSLSNPSILPCDIPIKNAVVPLERVDCSSLDVEDTMLSKERVHKQSPKYLKKHKQSSSFSSTGPPSKKQRVLKRTIDCNSIIESGGVSEDNERLALVTTSLAKRKSKRFCDNKITFLSDQYPGLNGSQQETTVIYLQSLRKGGDGKGASSLRVSKSFLLPTQSLIGKECVDPSESSLSPCALLSSTSGISESDLSAFDNESNTEESRKKLKSATFQKLKEKSREFVEINGKILPRVVRQKLKNGWIKKYVRRLKSKSLHHRWDARLCTPDGRVLQSQVDLDRSVFFFFSCLCYFAFIKFSSQLTILLANAGRYCELK